MSGSSGIALSWSGGKDSALALWALRGEGIEPAALLTTLTEDHGRISMHAVRAELLRAQAAAAGIELGETVARDGFALQDLLPTGAAAAGAPGS